MIFFISYSVSFFFCVCLIFQPEASTTAASAVADSFDAQPNDGTASPFDTISSSDVSGSRSSPFAGDSQASAFDNLAASKPVNFDSPKKPGLFPIISDEGMGALQLFVFLSLLSS